MTIVCPTCQAPLDAENTLDLGHDTGTVVCSRCGMEVPAEEATRTFTQSETASSPRRLANFSLVRLLGRGGFGAVWLAHDERLDRDVALKLPKRYSKDAKLTHEAQTAAKLRHPNIVSIYEVGVEEEQVFIASEFIDGEDLRSELANGRPEVGRAIKLIATLARAVHHAHEHGVVHRDLKPANIMLDSKGEPFITDFGIAKHLSADETISTDGEVIGTVSYMSPEQARGDTRDTDHRSDIYALGVMLFEMLTEFRPFRGTARAVIQQKIEEDAPSPRKLVPSLPKDLETISLKCLERDPAKRYSSAFDLADELDRYVQGIPIKARPISRGEKCWRWCQRKPAIASLALALFVSLVLGLAGVSFFWQQAEGHAERHRTALYRTNMHLASKLWKQGDIAGLRQTLNKYDDDSPEADLRGFEWHFYHRLTEPFEQIVHHGDVVTDVAISREGNYFASVGGDQAIRVWATQDGSLIRSLQIRTTRTAAIEYSPVDDRIAAAHLDGVVRIWHPTQHDRPAREFQHGAGLSHVRFSVDGKSLVSAGRDGLVRLWDISSSELVAELSGGSEGVTSLRVSPNGRWVAAASQGGTVTIWNLANHSLERRLKTTARVQAVAFTGTDGESLVTGTYGGKLHYWSVETGKRTKVVQFWGGAIGDLEHLTAADVLAVVGTNGDIILLDSQHRAVRTVATHALTHGMLAHAHNGSRIAVGSGDGSVKVLNVTSLIRADVYWLDAHVRDVKFAGRDQVVTCAGDGSIHLWNVAKGRRRELMPPSNKEMLRVAVHPNGESLAAVGMMRDLHLVSLATGDTSKIPLSFAGCSSVGFSNDGRWLACAGRNGTVQIFGGEPPEFVTEIASADANVNDLTFLTMEDTLVVAYSDGRLSFYNPGDGTLRGPVRKLSGNPQSITTCLNGREIAVGTRTGMLYFIDVATREIVRGFKAHSSRINSLAVLPGGRRLVSGGRDKELRIWDVSSGELVAALSGHPRQVFSIAVSPAGDTIVSGGLAGDIRLWRSVSQASSTLHK